MAEQRQASPPVEPVPIQIKPGIVKDFTTYTAKGAWVDGNNVRFVSGYPQSIGGWVKTLTGTVLGVPRAMFAYNDLTGDPNMGVGTNIKYYIEKGGGLRDVTPLRRTQTLGLNPISTVLNSPVITVSDAGHGAAAGDYVTFSGATATGGLSTTVLNAEYPIASIVDANTYTVNVGTNATSTATGGGAAVVAAYQIAVAADTLLSGGGWGAGTWGRGSWSSATSTTAFGATMRVWTHHNFGNDLIFCPRGGGIYRYQPTAPARGILLSSIGGATDVPVVADAISVGVDQRTLIAFGCNPIGSSTADPLLIRWGDRESQTNWTPGTTTTAGGLRLSVGSVFYCAIKTRAEHIVFTDQAVYSLRFVGGSDFYGQNLIAEKVSTVGPFAAGSVDQTVYWWGRRGFYKYDGRITRIECPIENWLDKRIDKSALARVTCMPNSLFGEVWWTYQKIGDTDANDFVIYDYVENCWSIGVWPTGRPRTAWLDQGVYTVPRGADKLGQIWSHESGLNDDAAALPSFIQSGDTDMDAGGSAMFLRTIWPDLDFLDSSSGTASVAMTLFLKDKPGKSIFGNTSGNAQVVQTSPGLYTNKLDIGKRARTAAIRIENTQANVAWRLGTPRILIKADGKR